jgi:hypothetical protein
VGAEVTRGRFAATLLGAAFLWGAVSGRAALYVRGWFVPAVALAGFALLAVALRGPVSMSRPAAAWLLLPVLAGAALTPSVVGRISTGSGGAAITRRVGDGANRLLRGDRQVTLLDVFLAERQVGGVALAGRSVSVEARVAGPGLLDRLVMVCCAADARPVTLRMVGMALPSPGTWVRVSGHLSTRGDSLVLAADRVERIPTPDAPIL